jgi:hypothetical protein
MRQIYIITGDIMHFKTKIMKVGSSYAISLPKFCVDSEIFDQNATYEIVGTDIRGEFLIRPTDKPKTSGVWSRTIDSLLSFIPSLPRERKSLNNCA